MRRRYRTGVPEGFASKLVLISGLAEVLMMGRSTGSYSMQPYYNSHSVKIMILSFELRRNRLII